MASENCMSISDSWSYRPCLPEGLWTPEPFARDNDVLLARALSASETQTRIRQQPDVAAAADDNSRRGLTIRSSKTDPATAITGKVSKRRSRASKKSPTTYINADPANFRQMVQQVTGGVRFPLDPLLLLNPEPLHRAGDVLPTLDTSALLAQDADAFSFSLSDAAGAEGDAGSASGSAFGFDAFSSFPTLESWGGM